MSTWAQRWTASIGADAVSPLVAPTSVTCSPRAPSTWSKSRPTSCRATSLNASVGPWKSSANHWRWSIWTSGTTAGWRNVAYASSHIRARSLGATSSPTNGAITRSATAPYVGAASSTAAGGSSGHEAGTYSPPSAASPSSSTSAKPSSGARPRVETYRNGASAPDDAPQPADLAHDVELAQPAHRRLDRRLPSLVGDEHEAGVGADALLLGGAD